VNATYAKSPASGDPFFTARETMETLIGQLQSSQTMTASHADLEGIIRTQGRELERQLLQAHLDLRSERERPVAVRGEDGVARTYRRPSQRPLMTVLGPVVVSRLAYQAEGVKGLHPMDGSLNLPPDLFSLGVRRFVAEHAAMQSFDEVVAELHTQTGAPVGKRQVEQLAVRAALDFEAFYAERRAANDVVEPTRDLLVMTFDGKGIVMVPEDLRPATKKAAKRGARKLATRLTSGEKRNRKRMAEVAAIYTVPRYVRTPLDVLANLDGSHPKDDRPERPKVRNKRVWASVEQDPEAVIAETFHEARARDPQHRRQWVVLIDGNKDQLSAIKIISKQWGPVCIVIDLIHVLEYLWRAAHALCGEGTKEAEAWVQRRLASLLQGRPAGKIATAMRKSARAAKLRGNALRAVRSAAKYLQDYAPYMRYADAIQWGLPIATGVIEGACRYLVKDRMDRGGARWTLTGAEAVLRLRALRASGDFEAYWQLHLREEQRRNHTERYEQARLPDPIRPLRRVK
jgi:hypothetical protein